MTLYPDSKNSSLPLLKARQAAWIKKVVQDPDSVNEQMEKHGSPINVLCTQPFLENYREYETVFEERGLRHLVLFARKANKATAFVKAARAGGFGVDTASYRELQQCLQLGCDPDKLVYTAAIKDRRSIYLAVQSGVLIILDNRDEWSLVKEVATDLGKQARVGMRISGFQVDGEKLYSRFGFDVETAREEAAEMFAPQNCRELLQFSGLHFHLDGYSTRQRGVALHAAMDLAVALQSHGLQTRFIDIGGGFLINYLESGAAYKHFEVELRRALKGDRPPITFNNDGLGLKMIDGELQGQMKVYPYFNRKARTVFLKEVLDVANEAGLPASDRARSLDLEIRMEPGRSLLDQTGMTMARVAHRKWDSRGELLVGLEMNMTQMYSSSADFLLDPIVIHRQADPNPKRVGAYFTGAYCLERDVLLKRKIQLEQVPEIGDLVVFPNTAGYMMHFFESEAHLFELAANLIYDPQTRSFCPDDLTAG